MKKLLSIFTALCAFSFIVAAPVVSNVVAAQSGNVILVSYNLSHPDNLPCDVSLMASSDGGASYTIIPDSLSGDYGQIAATSAGAQYQISWHFVLDNLDMGDNYRVKVIADDGVSEDLMVLVPGGTFNMGDTHGVGVSWELPVHSVTLSPFYLSRFEVTQGEWVALMGSNPVEGEGLGDNRPINTIRWFEAVIYCNIRSIQEGLTPVYSKSGSTDYTTWGEVPDYPDHPDLAAWNAISCNWSADGYRLPTEAEWEYAARGATDIPDYLYSGSDDIMLVAWFRSNSAQGTQPVGTLAPNGLGIYDMSGNVYEYCWDWLGSDYYSVSPQVNPTGPDTVTMRVGRGGNYRGREEVCTVTNRAGVNPYMPPDNFGFRLCRKASE